MDRKNLVIVAQRAFPNSRCEPTRRLRVTFISLWWFLLHQLPRNSGCSYASKVAEILTERSCNMLIVKEKVLRISNVLKLFLWNLGARGVVKSNNRTLWDYELNWFDLISNDEYMKAEGEHISVTFIWIIFSCFLFLYADYPFSVKNFFMGNYVINLCRPKFNFKCTNDLKN